MSKKRATRKTKRATRKETQPPIVAAELTRCPQCGSTERTKYHAVRERPISGILPDGRVYTAIKWRRTTCTECGQVRIERTHVVRHAPKVDAK